MRLFITGATGFVGRHLLAELQGRGHEIIALVRRSGQLGGVEEIPGDVTDLKSISVNKLAGCQAAIHLVGIIREFPRRGITFPRLHVEATKHVIAACRAAGIRRLIHMSALGASHSSQARYLQTKAEAEELVRASGLDWTIIRPAVIIGRGGEFLNALRGLVKGPIVPLLGGGSFMVEPVAATTVSRAFANALERADSVGKTYQFRGEAMSFRDLLKKLAQRMGQKTTFLNIPLPIMRALATYLDRFPLFPITREQMIMLQEYQSSDDRWAYQALSLKFKGIDEILSEAL
jgi:NADH dehydrogenase